MPHAGAANRGTQRVRPEAYRILSQLYLGGLAGPEPSTLWVAPEFRPLAARVETEAPEAERRFPENVPLVASAFLEVDGQGGGDISATLVRRFASVAIEPSARELPDHLGNELALLAALTDRAPAEPPDGGRGGQPDEVLGFLDGHVLWWLPALAAAVGRLGSPFWREAAELTLRLTVDHRRSLAGERLPTARPPWTLMGLRPDPLDDPTVGLREISIFLTHPARSGLHLSEADALASGDAHARPPTHGPDNPAGVLETVFHFAAAHHRLDEVVSTLRGVVADVFGFMEEAVDGCGLPAGFVAPWIRRLDQTDAMLVRMARGEGPFA
jgi:hypothetical protein